MTERRLRPHHIVPWLWIAPAILFVLVFLALPVLRTFLESFRFESVVRESVISEAVRTVFYPGDSTDDWPTRRLRDFPDWERKIGLIGSSLRIRMDADRVSGNLTLSDLSERFVAAAYQGARSSWSLANYRRMSEDSLLGRAFVNNLVWLLLFTGLTVGLGLVLAGLAGRIRWFGIVRTVVFLPMAVSFVAASVIWGFFYEKDPSLGLLNAVLRTLRFTSDGVAFLGRTETVTPALILAGVWMWTGYCTVVFDAALRGIPPDALEAARLETSSPLRIFWSVQLPMIRSTIVTVTTIMIITVLKVFDIVYTLTGGGPFGASEVLANRMYRAAFNEGDRGYAAVLAVLLFLAVLPVLVLNIRNFSREERERE